MDLVSDDSNEDIVGTGTGGIDRGTCCAGTWADICLGTKLL